MGQDRWHPAGNALTRFGFQRSRAEGTGGSSGYLLPIDSSDRTVLVCWGHGIYVGPVFVAGEQRPSDVPPGVLLARHAFGPRLLRTPPALPVPNSSALGARHLPQTPTEQTLVARRLRLLVSQLVRYEQWALETLGATHRQHALDLRPRHKRRRHAGAPCLAEAWQSLLIDGWGEKP